MPPASALLDWYDAHRRSLPWRAPTGAIADPYHVWISEVMLQQTTVTAVIPYYHRFLGRFPTVEALARAPLDDVLAAWSGLGYYSRARNLYRCAQELAALGRFPRDVDSLRALPGIGAYTSAAIAAIAFGAPVVPVDGNVERIAARVFAVEAPLPAARTLIAKKAVTLNREKAARARPSDFAQALFDLGAGVCTPRTPACMTCPWNEACAARQQGLQGDLPRKAPKAQRPTRYGAHFLLVDPSGRFLLRRRPEEGLLGGTMEMPGAPWRDVSWSAEEASGYRPMKDRSSKLSWAPAGRVKHVFTHFTLFVDLYAARSPVALNPTDDDGVFLSGEDISRIGMSSLMIKCLENAMTAMTKGG
ncbi:A/G-specific adenine glycosylase [Acetobacter sacchari]|uniref:Adenine DNA glycosylase n=1 Tax=Acetobacter sacchari TaxID=2661687 RepID=A0ABS3LYC4_9PROT|nr:A/G-specific adenine glycosylase [Acetobacter sacchari]MBO1360912.1 A/G-specific adenine glycosylase [Acetobacter sacchari]